MPSHDKYTYPGSGGVLRNVLGIKDAAELDAAVDGYVSVEWALLFEEPAPNELDLAYLQHIHRRLFGSVFEWAGEVRDVELQAAGTNLTYHPQQQVQSRLDQTFGELAEADYLRGLDALDFVHALARTWAELTRIHPFRDGNTRSQAFFVSRLAEAAGHPIAWERVSAHQLRAQRLAAAQRHPEALGFYLEQHLVNPPSYW